MAEGIEKILECPICLEQIKNPKMLPCQHSFCLKNCLENLVDGSSSTKSPVLMFGAMKSYLIRFQRRRRTILVVGSITAY